MNVAPAPGAIRRDDRFVALPPAWPDDLAPALRAAVAAAGTKVVVLDDDPTGTQTVHDVPVLTEWSVESLRVELLNELPAVYLLTNSRSLPADEAQALNATIGHNLVAAGNATGRGFVVVSRSDSTLRGHYPGEVDALAEALGGAFDATLVIPFFEDGGRLTLDDVHYVVDGDLLVPAGETEFAHDATFGYRASNLRGWVEEKTDGRVRADDVVSVSLDMIRRKGPDGVAEYLVALKGGRVCIVNAVTTHDLEVFTLGLLQAEAQGRRFLYRTAASFVSLRAGLSRRALLTPDDVLHGATGGGLIVAGSYVPRTTSQLAPLLTLAGVRQVEVDVLALLDERRRVDVIGAAREAAEDGLRHGDDVLIMTSRGLVTGADGGSSLEIGRRVSAALVDIVRGIGVRPRYVLAKGGITSSDIATKALGVRRAMVVGQILPGVPVWQLGQETPYAGMSYIVFPGNVGGPAALRDVVAALRQDVRS